MDWANSAQKLHVLAGVSDYEHYPHRLFDDLAQCGGGSTASTPTSARPWRSGSTSATK
jgi:hypothetical protein